jgi:homeodomain interacting protein kinase
MLRAATKTSRFFNRDDASSTHGLMGHHSYAFWRLKKPEEHELETGNKSKVKLLTKHRQEIVQTVC